MSERLFLAVQPPDGVVEDLAAFLEPRVAQDFRWVDAAQWHVTLAFMAEVAEHRVDDLTDRCAEVAARQTAFPMTVGGGGAFPDPDRARVLWLGVTEGADALGRLSRHLRAAASGAGAPPDGTRFVPHLTVGRARRPLRAVRWLRVLDAAGPYRWSVDDIVLVRSHLTGGRPRHTVLANFSLGSA